MLQRGRARAALARVLPVLIAGNAYNAAKKEIRHPSGT